MKLQYDSKQDIIYIDLSKGKYNKTRKISDAILVDEDKSGKVLGIEILDAKENLATFDPSQTTVTIQSR
ncbi:MAG: hypothetical protein A2152_03780 [Candidatus Levybacteria bacterium RBG_16_35_6]|nr:MAG: hypothetical protein A2152_03780 [Candidatus Levybacteria bacterium RBG_16_35_6]